MSGGKGENVMKGMDKDGRARIKEGREREGE